MSTLKNVRVELFFRTTKELQERVSFLSSKGIRSFNLVNKSNKDDVLGWTKVIQEHCAKENISEISICSHYSMKYNKSRQKNGAFAMLQDFVTEMNELDKASNHEILIVSGSGPKGKSDSVASLKNLKVTNGYPKIAVAFNPFFPDENDYEEEKKRLLLKLSSGHVEKIYFQFGTNLERLREALTFLNDLKIDSATSFTIAGSIFLPTKKLIAQQKFRPWSGVFLSDEFLENEDGARGIVLQLIKLYQEAGAELLIEAPGVRNEKDWGIVENLLTGQSDSSAENGKKVENQSEESATKRRRTDGDANLDQVQLGSFPVPAVDSSTLNKAAVVLFNSHDMRLHDNVALQLASHHTQVIPLFLWSKGEQRDVRGCLEVILKDALFHINERLTRYNMKIVLRMGDDSASMLKQVCEECDVGCVYWNKGHTPETREKEEKYRSTLSSLKIAYIESQSSLLYDPIDIALSNGFNGGHWGTLMPFLRSCRKQGQPRKPIPRHETFTMLENMKGPNTWPSSRSLDELDLAVINGKERWDLPIVERFPMSEEDALANMNSFFEKGFAKYETSRSRADIEFSTSKLSTHLRVGTLSPNELYYKVEGSELEYDQRKTFTRRLAWRDLAYFHLRCFPKMMDTSIRSHYEETEWITGDEETRRLNAWKNGKTGFPLVDAAMKELYKTGWMTQSLRMIAASFLVEYLRVNWVKGCDYFHYTLADADTAINSMM